MERRGKMRKEKNGMPEEDKREKRKGRRGKET
jgi:hypothetical protein